MFVATFFTKSEIPKTASVTTLPMDVATNVQKISFGRFVVGPEFCKQTDSQTDRHTYIHTYRQTDFEIYIYV